MKGDYSRPFHKRQKQLETIQAAAKWTQEHGTLPTAEELAKALRQNTDCIYQRLRKLKDAKIIITRTIGDAERIERSVKSRYGNN